MPTPLFFQYLYSKKGDRNRKNSIVFLTCAVTFLLKFKYLVKAMLEWAVAMPIWGSKVGKAPYQPANRPLARSQ
jgi:hypothetical protein